MSIMKLNSLLLLSLLIVACDQSSNPVTDPQQSDLTTETIIDIDQDGYPAADDCDDNNQLVHVLKTFFTDSDLDGYGSLAETYACTLEPVSGQSLTNSDPDDSDERITPLDQDGDGTTTAADCNDLDYSIALSVNYYADNDTDGFGAGEELSICSIQAPVGYVLSNADPDDTDPSAVPSDTDGDGIANVGDCAPNDPLQYINQIYYFDKDGDTVGSGEPVYMCVAMPIPAIDSYSLITGDSCPDNSNWNEDFDDDGIDDSCDMEIRVLSDKVISGDEFVNFSGSNIGGKKFYFGAVNNPVTVEFNEGATLSLGRHSNLYLEGGSKLIINKTLYNKRPALLHSFSSVNSARIIGIGDGNELEFRGAGISLSSGAVFDGLERITVTTKDIYDPLKAKTVKYRTRIFYDLEYSSGFYGVEIATHENYAPTIKNSPGIWALNVVDQTLNVAPIKLLNNNGYPVRCTGNDLYAEESENIAYSACNYATYSRYEGNRFNGPLLDINYTNKRASQHFYYDIEMQTLNIGTKELYISYFGLQITDGIARAINFQNFDIKAMHVLSKDANGVITDLGLPSHKNSIPRFRVYNDGFSPLAYINFDNSDVREVPLIIAGGSINANNSQVGAVLFPHLGTGSIMRGVFTARGASTLDFAYSPYVVTDGINNYGMGLSAEFYGYVQLGQDTVGTTMGMIISDTSIDYPIIDKTPIPLYTPQGFEHISSANFRLKKSVGFEGTDVDSVLLQDSSLNYLYIKRK